MDGRLRAPCRHLQTAPQGATFSQLRLRKKRSLSYPKRPPLYRSVSAVWPGASGTRLHPDHAPGTGLFGLRSCRQQMLSPWGASIFTVRPLVMTNCLVSTYSLPRLSQSALFVITASTLTRSQVGLSRVNVADWLDPEEQAPNKASAGSHLGYRSIVRFIAPPKENGTLVL